MSNDQQTRRRVLGRPFGFAVGAWLAGCLLALGDMPLPPELEAGPLPVQNRTVNVGSARVGSLGPWTPEDRKVQRNAALWRLYMHGVVDFFAAPVAWETLLGDDQDPERWLDNSSLLNTNIRRSTLAALRLGPGESLLLAKRLPLPSGLAATDSVRVFVWMKGWDDDGAGPGATMNLVARDPDGKTLAVHSGPMRTRGTFGWHCYYLDVPLGVAAPPAAEEELTTVAVPATKPAALHVALRNPGAGTAWFSTLSWEVLGDEASAYAPEEKQDPATGSLAPFPVLDDLATHLLSGQAYAHPWRFFQGEEGGAKRVPDLTSPAAIRSYLTEAQATDPNGTLGGAVYLGPWLYAVERHPGLLAISPEWQAAFRETLRSLQDGGTGFWGTPLSPRCMAATARIVEYFWGGAALERHGFVAPARPWLGYGGGSVPRGRVLVETVLDARSRRQAGGIDVGAWGALAYEWRGDDESETEICSLATTRNAFVLLRLASVDLGAADRARVERALDAAWRGVFRLCVREDGLWKLATRDTEPSRPAFLPRILDLAPWLEERTDRALPTPQMLAQGTAGRELEFVWSDPQPGVLAVRLFAAPRETPVEQVRLAHLVGIVEREGTTVWNMDPLRATGLIRDAARAHWGIDIGAGPDVPFLANRLAVHDRLLGTVAEAAPLRLYVAGANHLAFYAASVGPQGEQSSLVRIEVPELAPPPEIDPIPAPPAEDDPFAPPAEDDPFAPPAEDDPFAPPEP